MWDYSNGRFEPSRPRSTRRDFLRIGTLGLAGVTLADWFRLKAYAKATEGKARSVIQLWMGGGPCHIDTFDPKPQAGPDYCGPYNKPIKTNVDGILIGQKLPMMAKIADKYALLRGVTHMSNAHEIGTYIMQTGTPPNSDLVYPSTGAVLAYKRIESGEYTGALPPYVGITSPLGRFSEAGFLGSAYKMFSTGGDPNAASFNIGGISTNEQRIARLQRRKTLLEAFDGFQKEFEASDDAAAMDEYQDKAYSLITGEAKQAFDIAQEEDKLRERYGRNRFGQSCLLARRLVERGVPFITINWGGWDTHKQHFERMDQFLPQLDQGFSALLEDLDQRGLLETTIVTWFGEFGRTPKIAKEPPWNGGRHHFCNAFSAVVAGGGFRGGVAVGQTDQRGERVIERPIYPWDISASMYRLLGIDPHGTLPHPRGCVAYVTPTTGGEVPSGGMLTEIM
ncbi:DUF1501 domain-containing protein [Thermostilla marina]